MCGRNLYIHLQAFNEISTSAWEVCVTLEQTRPFSNHMECTQHMHLGSIFYGICWWSGYMCAILWSKLHARDIFTADRWSWANSNEEWMSDKEWWWKWGSGWEGDAAHNTNQNWLLAHMNVWLLVARNVLHGKVFTYRTLSPSER